MNPYAGIDPRQHWKRAVVGREVQDIEDLYRKRFDITEMRISTAGSCFAQHIGRRLRESGFKFIDTEPAPKAMTPAARADFSYGLYSARFNNIYTTRQLVQLIQRAYGEFLPRERAWRKEQGFVDPFRPTVEPQPYPTLGDMQAARAFHLKRVRRMFETTDLFVFTLGLTETWASSVDGAVYPVAPGVSGGDYDRHLHTFLNLTYEDVKADLEWVIGRLRSINPDMHFLFTVSPVPLMATATDDHVLVATSHSKAILRAAAGHFVENYDFVDYFPSYEIISSPVFQGGFYEANKRDVRPDAVDYVMSHFFAQHRPPEGAALASDGEDPERVVCEEELLATFGQRA